MSSSASTDLLLLNREISFRLQHVGAERQPLMVVDNVLADPQSMIDAARQAEFYTPEHTRYPGVNARLPEAYYQTVVTALRGPIEAAFGLSRMVGLKYFGFFALATTSLERALPIQKIPHRDSPDPNRLAMVHYLCRGTFGGTGFFRHKATGFESVDAARDRTYVDIARAELDAARADIDSFAGSASMNYEMIGEAKPVFNRLIMYRSHVLHSALLANEAGSADPTQGRLTANGFIEAANV